jgi:uncharacterized protein (TIGR03435 family)
MRQLLAFSLFAVSALAQSPTPATSTNSASGPAFQVATIKPSAPDESRTMQVRGNRFATTGTSVFDLLKYACGLHDEEIAGAPKWMATQKFDLMADPETQARPTSAEFKKMVQDLLAERFHLVSHYETRDLSVFEVVVAKSGARLKKSAGAPDGFPSVGYAPGELDANNATLADFASDLQRFVTDRPVFDATGIAGKYNFALRWTPDAAQPDATRPAESNSTLPGLFTAIQEQMGLKLEEARHPAQVFVVDRIEMPTEN